jgi:aromatic-L-amino-acid decarboxylase
MAPHPLSVVCFRHRPPDLTDTELDAHNLALVEYVNATGEAFFSTTKLNGNVAIRIAIGNERTTEADVAAAWRLLREAGVAVRRTKVPV